MARTFTLHAEHALGLEGAKAAINQRCEALRALPIAEMVSSFAMSWTGDTAHVSVKALGATATAEIVVTERDVTIAVRLPLVLAPFAGVIQSFIGGHGDALGPPHPGTPL